ncbi:MAG: Crp/Fnr family transcriptional regulator [Devosia sp.]|nr:Crp/Fnr family transcriptional regulator [Devosia sp.]
MLLTAGYRVERRPTILFDFPGVDLSGEEIRNRILLVLRPAAQDFIGRRLTTREITAGEVIYEDGMPITHAVFPHEGVISLMARMENGRSVEKASVGLEGFLGFGLLMGGGAAFSRSVVTVPGYASWLSVADMDEALAEFVCVREAMLHYAKALIVQCMESVACNSLHSAEHRVTRWLLHAHDRVAGDRLVVTQQAISEILGLRRATVSGACSKLQKASIMGYSRGVVTILDRPALEQHACECYGRVRKASML